MLALVLVAAAGASALVALMGADEPKETPMQSSDKKVSRSGYDIAPLQPGQVELLASKLTPEQYRVTQKSGKIGRAHV